MALPYTRWLPLAVIGLVLVVVAGIGGVFLLRGPRDPAVLLPAQDTLAYFHKVTQQDVGRYAPWFPPLTQLPHTTEPFDLALVWSNNTVEWVLFPGAMDAEAQSATLQTIEGRRYMASADVSGLLMQRTNRLVQAAPYKRLIRGQPSFAFFNVQDWKWPEGAGDTDRFLRTFLINQSSHLLLAQAGDTLHIRAYGSPPRFPTGSAPRIPVLSPSPSTTLALAHPQALLSAWSGSGALMEQAVLRAKVRDLLGDDVSLQYDLLPLLDQSATLHQRAASGTGTITSFLLEGNASAAELAALPRLHKSAASLLQKGTVVRTTFDEDTVATQVRADATSLEHTQERMGNWQVESTLAPGGTAGLVTGTSNRKFFITNNPQWAMQQIASESNNIPLPAVPGAWTMGGVLNSDAISPPTQDSLAGFLLPHMPAGFAWSMATASDTVETAIRPLQ